MATLRTKRKLAAVTRETQEENPRNGQSRNTSVPRINEEYITQVSEEIEGRITKKLSQEFNRIESRISDALSKLDEFLSNQQIQTYSETVPGTFRNTNVENQGTNEDDSQSDPHPEGGLFRSQTTQNSGPEAGHYNGTWLNLVFSFRKKLRQEIMKRRCLSKRLELIYILLRKARYYVDKMAVFCFFMYLGAYQGQAASFVLEHGVAIIVCFLDV